MGKKSEKIKVGFVGAGWMGQNQLQRLTERNDVEICALLEPDKDRGGQVLTNLGLPTDLLVDDYGRIIENKDIDAVWLVSPNCFHGPQSIAAMKAGKHVFCEKPCATEFGDFCEQIELEKANPDFYGFKRQGSIPVMVDLHLAVPESAKWIQDPGRQVNDVRVFWFHHGVDDSVNISK